MATKILYVITKANFGGAQRYVLDLALAARDSGYEVLVAYGSPGELADRLHDANINTIAIAGLGRDMHIFKDVTAFFSLLKTIRLFGPNVIHLNSSKIGGIGALAARIAHVPKILFTAHAWTFNEERPWYQKIIIAVFAWMTVTLSTRTIVVSDMMKRQILRGPFIHKKVVRIPNGTRSYELLTRDAARKTLVALHPALSASDIEHDQWVGTVAELHPVKGLTYAIDAVALLHKKYPSLRYLIVSEGDMRKKLEEQIARLDLYDTVFLLGRVKDAPLYGKAYDVFLLPSISEAFGIALLEAGLAALPVVATRVGGIPEIITSDETGLLVPPRDPHAIADAIDTLLANEILRQRLGTSLEKRVHTNFSIETFVHETFKQY